MRYLTPYILGLFLAFNLLAQDTSNLAKTAADTLQVTAKDSLSAVSDSLQVTIDTLVVPTPSPKPKPVVVSPTTPIAPQKPLEKFAISITERGKQYLVQIQAIETATGSNDMGVRGDYPFKVNTSRTDTSLRFVNGTSLLTLPKDAAKTLYLSHKNGHEYVSQFYQFDKDRQGQTQAKNLPLWVSLIPPLLAIFLALIFREVIASLFIGIWAGAFILNGFSWQGLGAAFLQVIDKYIIGALTDPDHIAVIVFSLLIGGMVAIISKNGGMAGVVRRLSGMARGPRSSQFVTWLLGIAIFFDDYANTLIVGNTARPLTDKHRVSREKLAYIVDSTAAPVAAIAFVTTWIGAELGYISDATEAIGSDALGGAYDIFLQSLYFSYYPILTLLFILMLILLKRDFGPMWHAENRARTTGKLYRTENEEHVDEGGLSDLTPVPNKPQWAFNAVIPILTVIIVTLISLIYTGSTDVWHSALPFSEKLRATVGTPANLYQIIGDANSYTALLWSSISGVTVATFLTLMSRIMPLRVTMDSLVSGIKTMMPAMVILVLAWSLAQMTKELHTANYLTVILQGSFDPQWLPVVTFCLAGITAFSTGSSWSTMAILYPLILPATWLICDDAGFALQTTLPIFYSVTSAVLAGSVFGDHCSPISDTTILSSLASNCNHIDHVRTQLPYAFTVALVSVGLSAASIFYNLEWWMNFGIGIAVLFLIILLFGSKVNDYVPSLATTDGNAVPPKRTEKPVVNEVAESKTTEHEVTEDKTTDLASKEAAATKILEEPEVADVEAIADPVYYEPTDLVEDEGKPTDEYDYDINEYNPTDLDENDPNDSNKDNSDDTKKLPPNDWIV